MRKITRTVVALLLGFVSLSLTPAPGGDQTQAQDAGNLPVDRCEYVDPCRVDPNGLEIYPLPDTISHYPCDGNGHAPAHAPDETFDLQAWVDSVPNGVQRSVRRTDYTEWHVLLFPGSRCIRMDGELFIRGRHYLVFDGRGVTLDQHLKPARRDTNGSGAWEVVRGSFLEWRSFRIVGNNPQKEDILGTPTKVSTYGMCSVADRQGLPSCEWQNGWALAGPQHVTLEGNETRNTSGDSVEIGWDGYYWSDDVVDARYITINNHSVYGAGRQGISAISGQDITISNSYIEGTSHHAIDLEPESSDNRFPIRRVTITNNRFGQNHMTNLVQTGGCVEITDVTYTHNTQVETNTSWLPSLWAERPSGCQRQRGPFTITNNTFLIESGEGGDMVGYFKGYSNVTFSSNSARRACSPLGCTVDAPALDIWGGSGHVVNGNNLDVPGSQPWKWIYRYDGVPHGSLGSNVISLCGNMMGDTGQRPFCLRPSP